MNDKIVIRSSELDAPEVAWFAPLCNGDDEFLSKHESPEDIELYFCGPPMMNQSVLKMAEDWGMPDENVSFDDFGGSNFILLFYRLLF